VLERGARRVKVGMEHVTFQGLVAAGDGTANVVTTVTSNPSAASNSAIPGAK